MTYFCHTLDTNLPQQESGRERVIHMFVNRMWINTGKQKMDSTVYAQEKANKKSTQIIKRSENNQAVERRRNDTID